METLSSPRSGGLVKCEPLSVRARVAACVVAAALSATAFAPGAAQEPSPVERTLQALRTYRAADTSTDLQERLRLQRELAHSVDVATVQLAHDVSRAADDARNANMAIRIGIQGDPSSLALADSMLESVINGESATQLPARPTVPDVDSARLLATLASDVQDFREAVTQGDADQALAVQGELLNDRPVLELRFRHVPTETAQRVRSAIDDLDAGLDGDADRLDEAGCSFGTLAMASNSSPPAD